MRELDFAPEWYTQSLLERACARVHVTGFLTVAALLVLWTVDATARSRADQVSVNGLEAALASQGVLIGHLEQLDQEIAKRERDLTLLGDLRGGVKSAAIVAELTHLAPRALSFRTLVLERAPRIALPPAVDDSGAAPPRATVLVLTGWARSGEEIANLVSRMSESALFRGVTLGYERSEMIAQRSVVAFKVECQLPAFE
jgi:hypothetical protein